MYCRLCGKETENNEEFCATCKKVIVGYKTINKKTIVCPYCGKETDESERFCEHCDGLIRRENQHKKDVVKEISTSKSQEKKKTCKSCYAVIPESAQICPKCHKNADWSELGSYRHPVSEGSYWGGFALSCLLGLIGLLIAVLIGKSETKRGAIHGLIVCILISVILGAIVGCVVVSSTNTYY